MMTPEQRRRYNRHMILEGIGAEGQEHLLDAKVLVVGAGGLGSPVLEYLAAAGVGTLGVVDGDVVSLSNLQRQIIHTTADIGRPKVESAAEKIKALNPDVKVEQHECFLSRDNAMEIISPYDFVIDCTDNFSPKYLINDACVFLDKPFCMGGINRFSLQLTTHVVGTACYRCLFPEPPREQDVETCAMTGVLGVIAGVCGTLQATECVKFITGAGNLLTDRCLCVDALTMEWVTLHIDKNADCVLCGDNPTIKSLEEYAFRPCKSK